METRLPKHISFDTFKTMVEQSVIRSGQTPFIGRQFAMTQNALPTLRDSGFSKDLFQFNDLRIGFIKSGEIAGDINMHPYYLQQGDMVCLTPNCIIEVKTFSKDLDLMGITLSPEQLSSWMRSPIPAFMLNQMTASVMVPDENNLAVFFRLFDLLWDAAHLYGDTAELTDALGTALLCHVHHIYNVHAQQQDNGQQTRERKIFQEFIQLVNQANGTQRQLDYYADRMHLTPRYLGTVVRQVSGLTAKEWIDRSTILRIKVMLRHSDSQITQIADALGFANDSFFSKYFKRLTGLTPNAYRNGEDGLQVR